jgi:hypothetical protein
MGEWSDDAAGLPRYTFLRPVPFPLLSDKVPREYLPEDPFFLIGNYRFSLFTHVSGIYEILSAERARTCLAALLLSATEKGVGFP